MNNASKKQTYQKIIAQKANISYKHLNDIINNRKRASSKLALALEKITGINKTHWLYPDKLKEKVINKENALLSR